MKRYNNTHCKNNPPKNCESVTIVLNRHRTSNGSDEYEVSWTAGQKNYFKIEEMIAFYKYLYAVAPLPHLLQISKTYPRKIC